jgi:Tol biopolymer transport system component
MPVFVAGGRRVVAMENAAADGDLYVYDRDGRNRKAVAAVPMVQEYFPARWDDARLLYVRWHAADNRNDQIFAHDWKTGKNEPLAFCRSDANYSDPYPADGRWVFFSSTREKGVGAYDLYIGDSKTGMVHVLGIDGLNTKAEELGASYMSRPAK